MLVLSARGQERERDRERVCAAAARSRIHGFAKSLLTTESTDWDGLYNRTQSIIEQKQIMISPFHHLCLYIFFFFYSFLLALWNAIHSSHPQSTMNN